MTRIREISEKARNSPHFKRVCNTFLGGTMTIEGMKMYDPYTAAFLTCRAVELDIVGDYFEVTGSEIIDGTTYLEFYVEGYKDGIAFLIQNYIPSLDSLYGPNNRIDSIRYQHHARGLNSWSQWYGALMLSVSEEQIKKFGYYAGILSELERLADEHKPLRDAIEISPRQRYPHRDEKYRPGLFHPQIIVKKSEDNKTKNDVSDTNNENPLPIKVEQRALALFYHYCHATSSLPPFTSGKMEQSYRDATAPYNLSWKPFQQFYGQSKNKTFRLESLNALYDAIAMLEGYPRALQLAKDELNSI